MPALIRQLVRKLYDAREDDRASPSPDFQSSLARKSIHPTGVSLEAQEKQRRRPNSPHVQKRPFLPGQRQR